jgi:hypothetical protein
MADSKRRCSGETNRKTRCSNQAWWPGGWCHAHLPSMTFIEWLVGVAAGAGTYACVDLLAKMLPRFVTVQPLVRHRFFVETTGEPMAWDFATMAHGYGGLAGEHDPDVKVYLCAGGRRSMFDLKGSEWAPQRAEATPMDAIVAADKLMSLDGSLAAERLAIQVRAAAQLADELSESIRLGIDVSLVAAERERLGSRERLPYHGSFLRDWIATAPTPGQVRRWEVEAANEAAEDAAAECSAR